MCWLQGLMETLNNRETAREAVPPPGSMKVQLHRYQRQFLGWALVQEQATRYDRAKGGLLAGG